MCYFDRRRNWKLKRVICNNKFCKIKSHLSPFFSLLHIYINNNLSLFASTTALIWKPTVCKTCQMRWLLSVCVVFTHLIFFSINSSLPLRTKVMYFSPAISLCWTCWGPFLCVMRKIVCKMFPNSLQPSSLFLPSLCICMTKILEKPRVRVTNNEIMTPNKIHPACVYHNRENADLCGKLIQLNTVDTLFFIRAAHAWMLN